MDNIVGNIIIFHERKQGLAQNAVQARYNPLYSTKLNLMGLYIVIVFCLIVIMWQPLYYIQAMIIQITVPY